VDGCDLSFFKPKCVIERLGERRQALCCAARVADHLHLVCQDGIVDAIDDRCVNIFPRGADNDLFCASMNVCETVFFGSEQPGAFIDDINAESIPREFGRVSDGERFNLLSINFKPVFCEVYIKPKSAVGRVEL
jgi:hypothetical protein